MAASLYMVSAGQTAEPTDINQLVTVLAEPAGGTENGGTFIIAGPVHSTGDVISCFFQTLSRVSIPVNVFPTVTSNGGGASNTISVGHLSQNGFQLYTLNTTSLGPNAFVLGTYYVQY